MADYLKNQLFQLREYAKNIEIWLIVLIVLIVLAIIFTIIGLILDEHLLFLFGLIFSIASAYLLAIWWEKINGKEKLDIKDIIKWRVGIGGIVRFFIIILILMSIGRFGTVIIYESSDSLYPVLRSNESNAFKSFFSNMQPDFIRSEIGRILFLIILINIYSIVPYLIDENKKGSKVKFSNLILTSLLLALILTLAPEGVIGSIKLNINFESAISVILLVISFIITYVFIKSDIDGWLSRRK